MTVLPYLFDYHYGEDYDNNHIEYYTEHQLNGMLCFPFDIPFARCQLVQYIEHEILYFDKKDNKF